MKQFALIPIFYCLFLISYAQEKQPVYVSSWVNIPSQEKFTKSLLFVDFWATWCGPCIQSMPHTDLLAKEFEDDVLFFYVSDEPSMKVEKFMVDRNKRFFSAVENVGNNISNFNISALPHSVLFDHQGNILWKGSPTDMNSALLTQFVTLYKGEQGKEERILKLTEAEKSSTKWNVFRSNSTAIRYLENQNVANEYSVDKQEYYISGDVNYFVSVMKGVPTSQVFWEEQDDKKYILSCKAKDADTFKDILKDFLKKKCKLDVERKNKRQKVYILENGQSENFFKSSVYNFEKGENIYLADEMALMIDNATIAEMVGNLSEFSEHSFVYKGKDKNKYDWNIHYKYNNFTLDQLRSELGFEIIEKEKKLNHYYISKSK